jgi:N-acetylglucosaminyldiphosphoundecaprenol N-acetyl-beta-D-mannosaminyltransferase
VIAQTERWIAEREGCRFIAVTGMHGVTIAQEDLEFKRILNEADLVVADGMPLVWLGRRAGFPLRERVCGPDFMRAFLEQTGEKYRHFLYGGAPGGGRAPGRCAYETA